MNKTPWFMAGGAKPTYAWQAGNGWTFGVNSVKLVRAGASIAALTLFKFDITPAQVSTVIDMMNKDVDVSGVFETWADFCQSHGINGGAN